MGLKHRVRLRITRTGGNKDTIFRGGSRRRRGKLLNRLSGGRMSVLVISPGDSVSAIEIIEEKGGLTNGKGSGVKQCCV